MAAPRLTEPGPTDMHWMSVVETHGKPPVIEFFDEEWEAEDHARAALATERTSVYVAGIVKHGEHRASGRRLASVK